MGATGAELSVLSLSILHLADVAPAPDSGAAGTDLQGVLALSRAGHRVTAVWADALPHRIAHYNLRYLLELPRSYREIVKREVAKQKFDVVQISQPHGYAAAKYVRSVADESFNRPVFVHRSHGFEPRVAAALKPWHDTQGYSRRPFIRRMASSAMASLLERNNRMIARNADGHIVSASECADWLERMYKVPAERAAVIPQGVPDSFLIDAAPIDCARLLRMLYVGQYAFVKAPDVLGRVVSQVLAANANMTFTWVCAAQHHRQALAHFGEAVRARVSLLNWMPQDELRNVYDDHGLFLFPSFFEGFGKAFLEAMSRGLVVVAADNGGMKDVITDGVDGFKVPTGDIAGMSACIDRVLVDFELAKQISAAAIKTGFRHSWDQYAMASTVFYERLIRLRSSER